MAVATILPQVTPAAVRLEFIHDESSDLAQDLMHDEPCMQLFEARAHAALLLDQLLIYASAWDHQAFRDGNHAAAPC
jgi:hypothetical protein